MDDLNTTSTAVPPQIPNYYPPAPPSPGNAPEEREPIPNAIVAMEAILRQPRRVMYHLGQPGAGKLIGSMLLISVLCALVYGVVVGSFSSGVQLWAAPLKIAGGMLFAVLICLPSLYIFACLSGSRAGFAQICGLVAGLVMLMTLLLIGFAPVAWLFSQSTASIVWMGVLHLLFWFVAMAFGLRFLQSGFALTRARSLAGLRTWVIIFVLVVVQMTTALRPLVGTAPTILPTQKKFFLTHWADCLHEGATARQDAITGDLPR
jgi:hypothetical protein